MSKKQEQTHSGYKTEDMLKAEAKQRAAEQAQIDALKKPMPPHRKKAENFWYHYKWATIGGVAALVLVIFFIKDMVFRTDPDLTIVMATRTPQQTETVEALQTALEQVMWDFNGDGKVSVLIDSIYLPAEPDPDPASQEGIQLGNQQDYAGVMKLTTVVAAGMDPLFLIDDGIYEHFEALAAGSEEPDPAADTGPPGEKLFQPLEGIADGNRLPFADTVLADAPGCASLQDTTFCLRYVSSVGSGEKKAAYHADCLALLEQLTDTAG